MLEKIKTIHTTTENGIKLSMGKDTIDYIIAPTVKEMVEKINEAIEEINKIKAFLGI